MRDTVFLTFVPPAAILKVNQTADTVRKLCLNPSSYVTDEWPGRSLIGPSDTKQAAPVKT